AGAPGAVLQLEGVEVGVIPHDDAGAQRGHAEGRGVHLLERGEARQHELVAEVGQGGQRDGAQGVEAPEAGRTAEPGQAGQAERVQRGQAREAEPTLHIAQRGQLQD
ncbi:MAG: hypothetical protein ACK559_28090, partial [bacterium]